MYYMGAFSWLPQNLEKCLFLKKVSENLEKSGENVEKICMSGNSLGIVFGLLWVVNILEVEWV